MATLNYQKSDDAHRENDKRLRLKMFGPSKVDVWRALAREVEARFEKRGGWWRGDERVIAEIGPWDVTLDTFVVSTGKSAIVYTRMRAPYVNADGFRFSIHRAGLFTHLAEKLGFHDVQVGHPEFDEKFVIKGNNEGKLRRLFANPRIRELIELQPSIHLEVRDDEGWFSKRFPKGVDELYFAIVGVIKDIDRLKLLYELFGETLHHLCHIGSAYEDDPNITL